MCADLTTAGPSLVAGTGKCPRWIHPNADEAGYYRFDQTLPELTALAQAGPTLDVRSRIGIVANLWAQVRAGTLPAEAALKILPMFDRETDRHVIEQVLEMLYGMSDAVIDDAARPRFRKYVAARLGPHKKALGWSDARPAAGGAAVRDDERALLRRGVLMAMGELAEDPATLKEAEPFASQWLKDPASLDGDTAQMAVELSARHATASRMDELLAAAKGAKTPQDRVVALRGLVSVDDPVLLARALDWMLTGDVKVQDVRYFLGTSLSRRTSRKVVYEWSKTHWDGLRAKLQGPLGARLMSIPAALCTKSERDDAEAFFAARARTIEGAERPLAEALESSGLCVELRAKASASASTYFRK